MLGDVQPDAVEDETVTLWGIHNADRGNAIFFGSDREGTESRLSRLVGPYILVKREMRSRVEKWYGPIEVEDVDSRS